MPQYDLVYRVNNYLERYIAWLHASVEALDRIEQDLAQGNIDAIAAEEHARQQKTEDFMREYRGLLYEWERANDVADTDRAAIKTGSKQAEALTRQLRERYAHAGECMARALTGNRGALDAVRRGHRMLNRYRPFHEDERQGGLVDRDA